MVVTTTSAQDIISEIDGRGYKLNGFSKKFIESTMKEYMGYLNGKEKKISVSFEFQCPPEKWEQRLRIQPFSDGVSLSRIVFYII